MKIYILLASLCTISIYSTEFIYPVAQLPDNSFYLIYQKTPHHIELWEWDSQNRRADQVLLSRFTPAGLKMLPSRKGFSFIDNGLIKIKQFIKRSPRTLDLDAPVGTIEIINWIDDQNCYTSARYRDKYGIFQIDYEGAVYPVCVSRDKDCMYPQKNGNDLFYIERDEYDQYHIMHTDYRAIGKEYNNFQDRIAQYWRNTSKSTKIFDFGLKPIVFLNMVSAQEGYVLSHPRSVSKQEDTIIFSCYHLIKQEGEWYSLFLFSFSIPSVLIFTGKESRLYEALLPLLPRYIKNKIFYVDSGEQESLNIHCYDHAKKVSEKISSAQGLEQFFGILLAGDQILYGGRLCDNPHTSIMPKNRLLMSLQEGFVHVSLGCYSLGK